jgi:hypothetical protein
VKVNDKAMSVGVPGRIPLPDAKGDAVIAAEFSASSTVKTRLLIGSADPFIVKLDGKVIGQGAGTGKRAQPDTEAIDVNFPAGTHTLTIVVSAKAGGNSLFARFLDPDRKLSYPDFK